MKKLFFLLALALLLRLPFLLMRGAPASDELSYFAQILHLLDIAHLESLYRFVSYDKPVFLLVNAPAVGLVYVLTGNPIWAVSWFPFLLNLLSVWLVYHLVSRLYDERTGLWAGLVWACLPVLVKRSANLSPESFYLFLMLLGLVFLHRALQSGRLRWLTTAALALACLGRVRPEGFGLFLVVLILLIMARRNNQLGTVTLGRTLLVFGLAALVALIVPSLIMLASFGSPTEAYYQGVAGKILGKLTLKLNHLFGLRTAGGLLSGNHLQYLLHNFHLVPAVAAVLIYDTLKTVFVLPTRLFPPLLLIFLSAVLFRGRNPGPETKFVEKALLISLVFLLAYPLLFFLSHSRYVFHYIPVLTVFIAVGITAVEDRLSRFRLGLSPSFLLGGLICSYFALFYFVIYVPKFRDRTEAVERDRPVRAWLAREFDSRPQAVMSEPSLPFHINKLESMPARDISLRDGLWGYWEPLSLENTLARMRQEGIRTLVVSTRLRDKNAAEPPDYFALTGFQIMGDGDEGLEMLRSPDGSTRERRCDNFYAEFIGLIDHSISPARLSLRESIPFDCGRDTLLIFDYASDGDSLDGAASLKAPGRNP